MPNYISFCGETTDAKILPMFVLICRYEFDFMQKNGLSKIGLFPEKYLFEKV
jgi:hypothetical protein